MILKSAAIAIAAALPLLAASGADAKTRLRIGVFNTYDPEPYDYYPGPLVAPRPRYYYYYDGHDDEDFAYEPDYYEPDYVEPAPRIKRRPRTTGVRRAYEEPAVRKRPRTVAVRPLYEDEPAVRKPARKKATQAAKPVRKKKADPVTTASTSKAPEKPKAEKVSGKLIPCSKASGIVADYGFSNVKSTDCQGQSYAFNATRDGKPFTIKVNSVSGELTEVSRQ